MVCLSMEKVTKAMRRVPRLFLSSSKLDMALWNLPLVSTWVAALHIEVTCSHSNFRAYFTED